MPKYIFFDLDNTLTRSRSPVTPSMRRLLSELSKKYEVLVVSGQSATRIAAQLGTALDGKYWSMGQNGNRCVDKAGKLLWEHNMNWLQKLEVLSYADMLVRRRLFPFKNILDLVDDRGSQISYSFVGHTEAIEKKEAFDPDKKKRAMVLKKFPFKSKTVEVKIAGTTCFDFYTKGSNKGSNIAALCKQMGWKKKDCLYVGDALFKNGNDESVIGVIPIQKVRDPKDTEKVVEGLLG